MRFTKSFRVGKKNVWKIWDKKIPTCESSAVAFSKCLLPSERAKQSAILIWFHRTATERATEFLSDLSHNFRLFLRILLTFAPSPLLTFKESRCQSELLLGKRCWSGVDVILTHRLTATLFAEKLRSIYLNFFHRYSLSAPLLKILWIFAKLRGI